MKRIDSIIDLSVFIEKYSIKGTSTNNYLLIDSYSEYINSGTLFCIENQSNACLLYDRKEFYQLYYYINEAKKNFDLRLDKPITMEILYRGHDQRPHEIISYWEKNGFRQHILREHMFAIYNQLVFFDENDTVEVRYAESDYDTLYAKKIIENAFDKYTGDILSYDELKFYVENKKILCAYLNGENCAVIQFDIISNIVLWEHFVVDEKYRGKGIATKLMQTFFRKSAINSNTRYQMWVMQENDKAKNMYTRTGFKFDNKISQSMINTN